MCNGVGRSTGCRELVVNPILRAASGGMSSPPGGEYWNRKQAQDSPSERHICENGQPRKQQHHQANACPARITNEAKRAGDSKSVPGLIEPEDPAEGSTRRAEPFARTPQTVDQND